MANNQTQFLLPSKGSCFLCLSPTQPYLTTKDKSVVQLHSLRRLHRYLKVHFGKVVNAVKADALTSEEISLVSSSSSNPNGLRNTDVRVEFCKDCQTLAEQFSKLHKQFESIRGDLNFCLRRISKRMKQNEEDKERGGIPKQNRVKFENQLGKFRAEVIGKLRDDMKEKCSMKFQEPPVIATTGSIPTSSFSVASSSKPIQNETKSKTGSIQTKHSGHFYVCKICNSTFAQSNSLTRHMKMQHPNSDKKDTGHPSLMIPSSASSFTFSCDHCPLKFRRADHLRLHLSSNHSTAAANQTVKRNFQVCPFCKTTLSRKTPMSRHKKFGCPYFKKKPKTPNILRTASSLMDSLQPEFISESEEEEEEVQVIPTPPPAKDFVVEVKKCQLMELQTAPIKLPTTTSISKKKAYTCDICKIELKSKHILQAHVNGVHLGIRYNCQFCASTFTQQGSLHRHYRQYHPGQNMSRRSITTQNETVNTEPIQIEAEVEMGVPIPEEGVKMETNVTVPLEINNLVVDSETAMSAEDEPEVPAELGMMGRDEGEEHPGMVCEVKINPEGEGDGQDINMFISGL